MNSMTWQYIELVFNSSQAGLDEVFWEILTELECQGIESDIPGTKFRLFFPAEINAEHICSEIIQWLNKRGYKELVAIHAQKIAKRNWNDEWKKYFVPVEVGSRFLVLPPWEVEAGLPRSGRIPIVIEPGMAFGTGTHATTQLCLSLMEKIPLEDKRVLDIGTGSGILAIAAALSGAAWCLATDIDSDVIENVAENLHLNHLAFKKVSVVIARLESLRPTEFDVVVCNMLLSNFEPLAELVPRFCCPGGLLCLSGFLASESEVAKTRVKQLGFEITHSEKNDEWAALLARKE
ncbi:MAG: 50S ribosomal protein L11 methyltransferase [Candidatus Sumerlaeaceae bacterium]|jgi:ribosomal protein L11 methyltransferase